MEPGCRVMDLAGCTQQRASVQPHGRCIGAAPSRDFGEAAVPAPTALLMLVSAKIASTDTARPGLNVCEISILMCKIIGVYSHLKENKQTNKTQKNLPLRNVKNKQATLRNHIVTLTAV